VSGHIVIARTTSVHGGRCQLCQRTILPGEAIVKVDAGSRGVSTTAGNGVGRWICTDCAAADD
jgi:hypothetical protein